MGFFLTPRNLISCLALAAFIAPSVVRAQASSAPPNVEHHYNPGARIVHTNYTCRDGYRSITMQYDRTRGRITDASRNGHPAGQGMIRAANTIIEEHMTYVTGIYPQCGSTYDIMIVSGRRNLDHVAIVVRWTPESAEFEHRAE